MKIGIVKEDNDRRVALVPDTVQKLTGDGHSVLFEGGAGASAYIDDAAYTEAGATAQGRAEVLAQAELVVTLQPLAEADLDAAGEGTAFISMLAPYQDAAVLEPIAARKQTALSMDMIPRSTRAQSMDVLSSMANIAGYKAVLAAAHAMPRYFPMLTTAAGSIPPAKVLVLGAGVAGVQAIATARRLGGVVEAFDTRSAVKEEVMSLGAKFVEVEGAKDDAAAGGYAVEQTEEYRQRQAELIQEKAAKSDVIITTAQLRGRPAPTLITEETVKGMKAGSVIVDLAASTGGNCALTENDKTVEKYEVIIIGDSELHVKMPQHASQLYSKNIHNLHKLLVGEEGALVFNLEDDIVASATVVHNGEVRFGK
ncbi:MAG TPA: Re/Si-specific NAD(P)(+) transhydrogenase subunit alpha [Cytophagales bacterium]|nr:Re/Si-specific NAD(P)(+) transhydrogenase subunit alpha [Cytophagales bacterium]